MKLIMTIETTEEERNANMGAKCNNMTVALMDFVLVLENAYKVPNGYGFSAAIAAYIGYMQSQGAEKQVMAINAVQAIMTAPDFAPLYKEVVERQQDRLENGEQIVGNDQESYDRIKEKMAEKLGKMEPKKGTLQ